MNIEDQENQENKKIKKHNRVKNFNVASRFATREDQAAARKLLSTIAGSDNVIEIINDITNFLNDNYVEVKKKFIKKSELKKLL
jgi:hypothetical protein